MAERLTGDQIKEFNVAAFDRALGILDKYITQEKTKGAREQDRKQIAQWEGAKKRVQEAKTMLADKTKALNEEIARDPDGPVAQAYNDEGLTKDVLTIAKIDELMNTSTKVNDVHMRDGLDTKLGHQYNKTKQDILTGKGRSVGIVRTLFGLGAASYATKGVTTLLANAGIISNPMGLMGLAKLVVPKLLTTVTSALTSFISFNPAGALLLGGALLVKLAPTIKRLVNKGVDFYKTMTSRKTASQNLLSEIENDAPSTSTASTSTASTSTASTSTASTSTASTSTASTSTASTSTASTSTASTSTASTSTASTSTASTSTASTSTASTSTASTGGRTMSTSEKKFWSAFAATSETSGKKYGAADLEAVLGDLNNPAKVDDYLRSIGVDPASLGDEDRKAITQGMGHAIERRKQIELRATEKGRTPQAVKGATIKGDVAAVWDTHGLS